MAEPAAAGGRERRRRVVLIGMMGVGKSTTGRLLAGRLGWLYVDTDEQVEAQTGKTVPEIIRESGEPAFRAEERTAVQSVMTGDGPVVVAIAGGAVLDPGNRSRIRSAGLVVWLRADLATLAGRVGTGQDRPLLGSDPTASLGRLYLGRRPIYESLADVVVDVDRLSPGEVVDRIEAALAAEAPADA